MIQAAFSPNFEGVCTCCGTSPTVQSGPKDSELCGPCYFSDLQMLDYWLWNEVDTTYLPTLKDDDAEE